VRRKVFTILSFFLLIVILILSSKRIPTANITKTTPTATMPSSPAHTIATDTSVPTTDTSVPTTDTSVPTTDTSVPTTDTSVPTTDTSVPTTDTYYVASTGSDSNPGTLVQPWLTIQHAIDTATTAGDTVNIMAGNYTTPPLVLDHSGSSGGGYITFQNYNGATVNIAVTSFGYVGLSVYRVNYIKIIGLRISAPTVIYYGVDFNSSNYCFIQNCYITNTKSSGIYSEGSTYITIDGCEVTYTNTNPVEEMISIVQTAHFEIKNCKVHDPGSAARCGIDMKQGCSYGSVHDNEVYNLFGLYPTGIYIDSRGITSNIDIYNNKVHDIPQGCGIEIGDENGNGSIADMNIYNNIVYKCYLSGFELAQRGTETFTNIYFINNTLYQNSNSLGYPEIYINTKPAYTTNCIIRNNIIYSTINQSNPIFDANNSYADGKLLIDHNLFYNSGGSFAINSQNIYGNNYIMGNPLFTSAITDFTIQTGSPAKNAGSATLAPSIDYIRTSRPQGAGYDIGAYEYPTG